MGSSKNHFLKYQDFKKEAEKSTYIPSKIENYFLAAYHLIESIFATQNIHTDLHKKIFKMLKSHPDLFGANTFNLMNAFRRIERDLRPGVTYGSKENGEKLKETQELFNLIETICLSWREGYNETV
ncbi:MAG: hypothetical protein ACTSRS_06625 [Candidatus Helarchaeota archaeon]